MPPIPAAALGATGGGNSRIWLSHDELGCDRVGVVGVASDGRGAVWGTGVLGNRCGVTTTARGSVAGDGAGSSSSAVLGVGDGRAGPVGVLNPQRANAPGVAGAGGSPPGVAGANRAPAGGTARVAGAGAGVGATGAAWATRAADWAAEARPWPCVDAKLTTRATTANEMTTMTITMMRR